MINCSFSQIATTFYNGSEQLSVDKSILMELNPVIISANKFLAKEQNEINSNSLRYGHVIKTDININTQGNWFGNTWKLLLVAPNAKSIDLLLKDIKLPEGAEINIYDVNGKMNFGPIRNYHIINGFPLATDIIIGDSLIVQLDLLQPISGSKVNLTIANLIYGYKSTHSQFDFLKSSANCQVNVECEAGAGWEDEVKGTAKIHGNGFSGGCALVNNTAQDFKAYFLTAKHIIDSIGSASGASIRFNYKTTTCTGSTIANGTSISNLSLKASSEACDMALLESSSDLSNNSSVTFLGWKRSTPNPSSVVCLHHPGGDVMKISKESSSINTNSATWIEVSNWDIGSIEKGSSGGPYFNQNKKLIGIQSLINSENDICTSNLTSSAGKLSYFWSSISSYLDPCNTGATYINSINTNSTLASISGGESVCTMGASFQLSQELGDAAYSWELTPSGLFSSPTSGTGTSVTAYPFNSSSSGSGQIQFYNECDSYTKNVWVGAPYVNPATITFNNSEASSGNLCANAFGNNFSFSTQSEWNSFDIKLTNLAETQTYCSFTIYDTQGDLDICSVSDGTYRFWVRGTNDCGTAGNWSKTSVVFEDCMGLMLMMVPNPSSSETTLTIQPTSETYMFDQNTEWEVEVYTESQVLKEKKTKIKGKSAVLKTDGWKEGVYFVKAKYKDQLFQGKLLVKK